MALRFSPCFPGSFSAQEHARFKRTSEENASGDVKELAGCGKRGAPFQGGCGTARVLRRGRRREACGDTEDILLINSYFDPKPTIQGVRRCKHFHARGAIAVGAGGDMDHVWRSADVRAGYLRCASFSNSSVPQDFESFWGRGLGSQVRVSVNFDTAHTTVPVVGKR